MWGLRGLLFGDGAKTNGNSLATVVGKEISSEQFETIFLPTGDSFLDVTGAILKYAEITFLSPTKREYTSIFQAEDFARNAEWYFDFSCSANESRLSELCEIFPRIIKEAPVIEGRLLPITGGGIGIRSELREPLTAHKLRDIIKKLEPGMDYMKVSFLFTGVPSAYEPFLPEGFKISH